MSISNVFARVYNARKRKGQKKKKMSFFYIITYFFKKVKCAHFFLFSSARIDYYGRLLFTGASHMMCFDNAVVVVLLLYAYEGAYGPVLRYTDGERGRDCAKK